MISTLLIIIFSLSVIPDPASCEKKQIYLAGTFPILGSEGWQGGQVSSRLVRGTITTLHVQACLPAALLALQDVNNNKDILTNYHINLAAKDDEVTAGPNVNSYKCSLSV